MMNPEIKKLWIEALNSDEYTQTQGRLRTSEGFCCLGVLTDLYAKDHNQEWNLDEDGYYSFEHFKGSIPLNLEESVLPTCVMVWSGLNSVNPYSLNSNTDMNTYLSDLNDGGYSFKRIAKIIEKNF